MIRRDFLKLSIMAAGFETLLVDDAVLGSDYKASGLVIGGGISGLVAARGLKANGFKMTLLEGRDRLGGRIWTDRSLGAAVDLGASWVMGDRGNPVAKLAKDWSIKTRVTDFDSVRMFDHDGRRVSDSDLEYIGQEFAELMEAVEEYAGSIRRDVSVATAIRHVLANEQLSNEERRALNWSLATLSADSGAEMSDLSLLHSFEDEEFAGEPQLFPDGYDQIITRLAAGLDTRLQHQVRKIEYGTEGVRVTTDRGTFEADGAVVTLPLGVLKSGRITFSPRLPRRKQIAIDRMKMGVLDKVALRFPRAFWPDRHFLGFASERRGEYPTFLNLHRHTGVPLLVAFAAGDFARSMESGTDRQIVTRVMEILRSMFGPGIPDPTSSKVTRWGKDVFAGGSYSHLPVGAQADDYDVLAEPVGETLFFAGEATNRKYPATVHGAFLSGIREVQRISRL